MINEETFSKIRLYDTIRVIGVFDGQVTVGSVERITPTHAGIDAYEKKCLMFERSQILSVKHFNGKEWVELEQA